MKATALALLLAAALLVAAASSERLPTFGEYLQQTPAGAASTAKTANADYPSVDVEEVQFVSPAQHDCRCFDGYWFTETLVPVPGPGPRCPTTYAQYDLACASKENYGYGYDYNTVTAIPVATPVGRCDLSENYFLSNPTGKGDGSIPVTTGVTQIGTFTGTCKLHEAVEDCEGRGPACEGMVVNVEGAIFNINDLYLKGQPAAMTFTDDCKAVFDGTSPSNRRTAGARKAGRAEVASYHDDEEERPYYERREEYYREREQYYSGYDRTYGYDEPVFYKGSGSVYHGTMSVVSSHKSAQEFETVGTFQYVFVYGTPNTTVTHPPPHAFITKGNTYTLGFFKEGKY